VSGRVMAAGLDMGVGRAVILRGQMWWRLLVVRSDAVCRW